MLVVFTLDVHKISCPKKYKTFGYFREAAASVLWVVAYLGCGNPRFWKNKKVDFRFLMFVFFFL